jgi:acetyl-CoA/propionyl-CoA carboxylase biotin carboxyl carrier protein
MKRVLIANRGEIAVPHHPHAARPRPRPRSPSTPIPTRRAPRPGSPTRRTASAPALARESYLNIARVIDGEGRTGRRDPSGYGFLSENAEFAQAVLDAGHDLHRAVPHDHRALGNKLAAREIAPRGGRAARARDRRDPLKTSPPRRRRPRRSAIR